jgi:hypothetical protein
MKKLLSATAVVGLLASTPAHALCPSNVDPSLCDTGTVSFIASNQRGYRVILSPSGVEYAIQYAVGAVDPAASGLIAALPDGAVRTIITTGQKTSLGDGNFFVIRAVRNWNQ